MLVPVHGNDLPSHEDTHKKENNELIYLERDSFPLFFFLSLQKCETFNFSLKISNRKHSFHQVRIKELVWNIQTSLFGTLRKKGRDQKEKTENQRKKKTFAKV